MDSSIEISEFTLPRKTYLEILKVHNKEVPLANLLAYFFRPKENHGLNQLFINTLLNTMCSELILNNESKNSLLKDNYKVQDTPIMNKDNITEVKTEVKTTGDKRIDILIDSDDFVICIEFKINHDLDNPLANYTRYIKDKYPHKKQFYIVMTPYRKDPSDSVREYIKSGENMFSQIILSDFISNVKKIIDEEERFEERLDSYEYNIYQDFIQTIENRKIRYNINSALNKINSELKKSFNSEFKNNNQGGFIEISRDDFTLKIRFNKTGWQIEKWSKERNEKQIIHDSNNSIEIKEIISVING
jgi:hypothetical protein